jgi:hypothetical protein
METRFVRKESCMSSTHGSDATGDGLADDLEDEVEDEVEDEEDPTADGNGDGADDRDGVKTEATSERASRPVVPAGPVSLWWTIAAIPFALLVLSWLAGAPQLALPIPTAEGGSTVPALAPAERLEGLARMLILAPVAAWATSLGVAGVAFARRRPIGDLPTLAAKCAAVVALSLTLWLVPSEVRMVKQAINLLGVPLAAAVLAVPVLRLAPRDAGLLLVVASTALAALVLGAWAIVWATG